MIHCTIDVIYTPGGEVLAHIKELPIHDEKGRFVRNGIFINNDNEEFPSVYDAMKYVRNELQKVGRKRA